jgi:polyhydroxyalkanoate synthesis regulator phasin
MTDEELKTWVYVSVGAASVCWTDMAGQGVFREDKATEVAENLLKVIRRHEQDVREDIAKRIKKMTPDYPEIYDHKILVGRVLAARVALEGSYTEDKMLERGTTPP